MWCSVARLGSHFIIDHAQAHALAAEDAPRHSSWMPKALKQPVPARICRTWRCEVGLALDQRKVASLWFPSGGSSRPELLADQCGWTPDDVCLSLGTVGRLRVFGYILVRLCIAFGVSTEPSGVLHVERSVLPMESCGHGHEVLGLSGYCLGRRCSTNYIRRRRSYFKAIRLHDNVLACGGPWRRLTCVHFGETSVKSSGHRPR